MKIQDFFRGTLKRMYDMVQRFKMYFPPEYDSFVFKGLPRNLQPYNSYKTLLLDPTAHLLFPHLTIYNYQEAYSRLIYRPIYLPEPIYWPKPELTVIRVD